MKPAEERLCERIAELARRTWPGAGPLSVDAWAVGVDASHAAVVGRFGELLTINAPNGRALEALYMALTVLAPEVDYGDDYR